MLHGSSFLYKEKKIGQTMCSLSLSDFLHRRHL